MSRTAGNVEQSSWELSEPISVKGSLELSYKWAAGIAGSNFLVALRDEGRLLGARCDQCDRVIIPPRIFCEECFGPTVPVDVPHTGTVETFTINHIATDAARVDEPWVLAIVRIDGTEGGFVHRVVARPEDVHIGMRVQAVIRDDRKGELLDIEHFAPVSS